MSFFSFLFHLGVFFLTFFTFLIFFLIFFFFLIIRIRAKVSTPQLC